MSQITRELRAGTKHIFSPAFEAFLAGAGTWFLLHDAFWSWLIGVAVALGSEHYWKEEIDKS